MILILLCFTGVAVLAAGAESLPIHAEPRPILWLATCVGFPIVASIAEAVAGARRARGARGALFIAAYGVILYPLGWSVWCLEELGWRGRLLPSLLLLLLPAAALVLWASPWFYRRESRAARDRAHENPPAFGRWLADRSRIVLVPLLILLAVSLGSGWLADSGPLEGGRGAIRGIDIVIGAAALMVLLAASPLLVRLAWRTDAFPAGPLRDHLEALARRLGAPVRAIRVWDERTRHVVNACAVGIAPGTRTVIFTRGLRDVLSDEELSAVFAHEAAHLAKGHLLLYAAMGLGFLLSLGPLDAALERSPAWASWTALAIYGGAFWIFGLGFASRRLEIEADLTAADASGHGAYASALRKAAHWLGPSSRRNGWRHLSLDRRLRIIDDASSGNDQSSRRLLRTCGHLRAGGLLFLAASAVAFACSYSIEKARESSPERAVANAFELIEEAESMRPIVEHAAARRSAAARWLGRDPAAIDAEYRSIVDAARRCAGAAAPDAAIELERRIEALP